MGNWHISIPKMYKWEYGTLYLYNEHGGLIKGFMDNEFSILLDYNEGDIIRLNMGTPKAIKTKYDRYMQRYIEKNIPPEDRPDFRIISFVVTEADVPDLNKIANTTSALEPWLKKKQIKLDQTI